MFWQVQRRHSKQLGDFQIICKEICAVTPSICWEYATVNQNSYHHSWNACPNSLIADYLSTQRMCTNHHQCFTVGDLWRCMNWVDGHLQARARVDLLMVTSFRLMHHRAPRSRRHPSMQVAHAALFGPFFPVNACVPSNCFITRPSSILPRKHFDCTAALSL